MAQTKDCVFTVQDKSSNQMQCISQVRGSKESQIIDLDYIA